MIQQWILSDAGMTLVVTVQLKPYFSLCLGSLMNLPSRLCF